jgi:excisionase family DNA binding protein
MTEALRILRTDAPDAPADDRTTATEAAPAAPALMTSAELSAELQISERTVRRLEITGKIGPAPINIGRAVRYRREDVAKWIAAGCPARANWAGRRVGRGT